MVIIWISRSGCDTQIGHCVSQSMNRESRPQPIEEMTESFKAPYSLLWGRMESPNMALEQAFPTEHWSGWWLGTFFIFPYIGKNHPNWLIFFRGSNHQLVIIDIWRCMLDKSNREIKDSTHTHKMQVTRMSCFGVTSLEIDSCRLHVLGGNMDWFIGLKA